MAKGQGSQTFFRSNVLAVRRETDFSKPILQEGIGPHGGKSEQSEADENEIENIEDPVDYLGQATEKFHTLSVSFQNERANNLDPRNLVRLPPNFWGYGGVVNIAVSHSAAMI
jgi:hypothetical protein